MEQEDKSLKRKPRFTEKEVDALIAKVHQNSEVLFSRFSDTITNKKKKMAWGEVQTSVNATSVVPRSVDEVRKKWDDVKRLTKKRAAGVRKDQTLTWGGERSILPLTNTEEIVVSLIGEERIYGIPEGICAFQQQLKATEAVEFPTSSNGCSLPVGTSMTTIPNSVHVPSEEVTITTATTPGSGKKRGSTPIKIDSIQSELLTVEKERLSTEKKRLRIEEDRLRLERERFEEIKKISGILLRRNTRPQIDPHLDVPSTPPTDKGSSQYHSGEIDYSYMYASLLLD